MCKEFLQTNCQINCELYTQVKIKLSTDNFTQSLNEATEKVNAITREEIMYVEEAIRNQNLSFAWYQQRAGRITGSTFKNDSRTSLSHQTV